MVINKKLLFKYIILENFGSDVLNVITSSDNLGFEVGQHIRSPKIFYKQGEDVGPQTYEVIHITHRIDQDVDHRSETTLMHYVEIYVKKVHE